MNNSRNLKLIVLIAFVFNTSCDFSTNKKAEVKDQKIDRIILISKGGDGRHNLKEKLIINNQDEISRLAKIFAKSAKLNEKVNVGANYGSVVVDMVDKESESIHYISIIYTVYDGVIIRDDLNGDKFKNDEFAGTINNLMSDNKINLQNLKDKIEND
ncbi:hypothetical protein [Flagellimonas hadalis]|uniref:Uncharacterized protein n=1 Tax=Flagellimonas hadalis TaxID=2597517 RepID=A0A5N5ING2_9FLAO|nr:hypothetical protein [Allomuricauda hadalis]KAB5483115.1 hypothetical protein FOT42_017825 [Allomuricauda hadalis]